MKRAFTLIEMLVVVAILATLMGIVFRLTGLGTDSDRKNRTIVRMQRVENCLSGYHAAFGSYPPVRLHGTRDIFQEVNNHGIQNDNRREAIWGWTRIGEQSEREAWYQVEAACRSQPMGCRFPYPKRYAERIRILSEELKELAGDGESEMSEEVRRKLAAGFDDGGADGGSTGRFERNRDKVDWRNIQLFKFGVMSFLLPRYLVMMNGDADFFTKYAQWTGNNVLPCDPFTGSAYSTWNQVRDHAEKSSANRSDLARLANIPSQAACARWLPNLEGTCQCNHQYVLFGIDINSGEGSDLRTQNVNIEIFSPENGSGDSYKDQYVLDGVTVIDGWWNEFFYYSPAPYQTYTLWSAGPNGRTFPPWISRRSLSAQANRCVGIWVDDDIIHMSN